MAQRDRAAFRGACDDEQRQQELQEPVAVLSLLSLLILFVHVVQDLAQDFGLIPLGFFGLFLFFGFFFRDRSGFCLFRRLLMFRKRTIRSC